MEERLRHLFRQYAANTCSRKELEEFFTYINRSEFEPQLRQLIKKVYQELKDDAAFSTYVNENGRLVLTETEQTLLKKPAPAKRSIRPVSYWLAAASIVVLIGLFWGFQNRGQKKENALQIASLTKKTTDRSESKFLLLEDGTKVWLNAASSLEFPDRFDPKKREVFLSGEAFFDVSHADKIPFIIHTGDIATTVLGTAFNIKAYPGQKNITVAVSRGKVKVSRKDGWETTLTMGQLVKVQENIKTIVEKNIPVIEVAAWQQGDMVFDDESFEEIIADLKRTYNANIEVKDNEMLKQKISTSFRKDIGIEQALQVLCKLTDSEFKLVNDVYLIQ
ncbi:MAG TPA: FecR domain-containing protein [Chitinophagaceae bacterium]